jgi:tetratricopeptide (TPR) repeat protein
MVSLAATALSECGETELAESVMDKAAERWPQNTLLHMLYRPTVLASNEIHQGNPDLAIEILSPAIPFENAEDYRWAKYIRGQAYLRLNDGENAAREFQKVLDYRGQNPLCSVYQLSYLGKARALRLSGNTEESIRFYERFLDLMKDADDDLPRVNEARAEYAELRNTGDV